MNRLAAAAAAMVLSVSGAAALVGDFDRPAQLARSAPIDVYEVAELLRDRAPVVLLDARPRAARERFSLPGAVGLDGWEPAGDVAIVLYGFEGNRDWVDVVAGHADVRYLAAGPRRWMQAILSPTIDPDAPPAELAAFRQRAPLARYFGGIPRFSSEPFAWAGESAALARLERRGCGF